MSQERDDYITVSEAARRRGVTRSTIHKAIKAGKLVAVKVWRGYAVSASDVDALVLRSHPSKEDSPYISIGEAARLLGVSRQRVYALMSEGRLSAAPDLRTDGATSAIVRLRRSDVLARLAQKQQSIEE